MQTTESTRLVSLIEDLQRQLATSALVADNELSDECYRKVTFPAPDSADDVLITLSELQRITNKRDNLSSDAVEKLHSEDCRDLLVNYGHLSTDLSRVNAY